MTRRWRFDFGSWSTFGQTALLIFGALTVAQILAFILMRNVTDQWQKSIVVDPAVNRFAEVAQEVAATPGNARREAVLAASAAGQRFDMADGSQALFGVQEPQLEETLGNALKKRGLHFSAIGAFRRGGFPGREPPPKVRGDNDFGWGPPPPGAGAPAGAEADRMPSAAEPGARPHPPRPYGLYGPPPAPMNDEIRLAVQLHDGTWLVGRFLTFRPLPLFLNPLFVSEAALFMAVLGIALFWASRISRPLRLLARAAENLRPQEVLSPISEQGPRDVRVAIVSFNAMAQRVKDLLQEKDRMLSAIGHDLRTPLASLKIRAESIEPAGERERIVETIDDMTRMVDGILSLARLGQSTEPRLLVDLSALADSVVEEFRELGKDVTFDDAPRIPVRMQPGLVRRLLRNLIDNAVKYGERARVSVAETPDAVELRVQDDGPGIPQAALKEVLQPFTRMEQSRSRETGGMGLGLSIADSIARSQGATLVLLNKSPSGLCATVRWSGRMAPTAAGTNG